MRKLKAVIIASDAAFYDGNIVEYVYGKSRIEQIGLISDLYPKSVTVDNIDQELPNLTDIEVIFSCWGMPKFTHDQLDALPELKLVLYAGGSVNGFAKPFVERGITVCNAVEANAIPVAEFCMAQILLACKQAYHNTQLCKTGPWDQSKMPAGHGVYGETVALVGIGAISRYLLKLLKMFNLKVIAVSGYLSGQPEAAKTMGIDRLVTIEEAFREAYVINNHLPDKASNRGILQKHHFTSMRKGVAFINTGRGAQVNEADMISVFTERPDLTALLDVQYPEPPEEGSELFLLPNIHLTSHIAGSTNDEVQRMADFMLEEFQRYIANQPLQYAVNAAELTGRA